MRRKRILLLLCAAFAAALVAGAVWLAMRMGVRNSLAVEARVSDDAARGAEPLADAELYLLDADMMRLALVRNGEQPTPLQERVFREHPDVAKLAGVMNARRREAYGLGPDIILLLEQSRALWEPHIKQRARTDAAGRARFSNLEAGDYWLMARARTPSGNVAFWNLPVTVARGENQVRLDALNSLQCPSCK